MSMEKAVLVTSFGTSHKDTRQKCLDSIENEVKAKYGSEKVERAYTSGVIRRIVERKEGIHIFDQNEGLEALKNKGYEEIVTMSLHILDGIEYAKLNDKYGKISKPLLVNDEDFKKRLQEEYLKAGKDNIFIATVEGQVTIEDVIQKLKGRGFSKILLKPFMIVAGDHAKNDMASDDEDSWKTILQNEGYEVTPVLKGMGEYKFIHNMFMDKLQEVY